MCELCTLGYSHDVLGFVAPQYGLDLGDSVHVAKSTTGSVDIPEKKRRWGVLSGKELSVLPDGTTIEKARTMAAGGCVVVRSIAKNQNGLVVWEKFEKIDDDPSGAVVDSQGVVLCKVARPGDQIASVAAQLASELVYQDRKWVGPYMKKYLARLEGVDWTTEKDVAAAFARAERILKTADVERLFQPWTTRIEVNSKKAARDGRQWLKQSFMSRISGSLTGADKRAVNRISTQQGWWLRDQTGKRADNLTARGREIVSAGLKDGLGRKAIGDQLKLAMPDLWNRYGNQYAQVNAAVAVNRARSFSMYNSYSEAGIQELEVVAVLDEVTTEQCRFMDGQILVVDDVGTVLNNVVDMPSPEDIKTVNPFINVRRNESGVKELVTARGDKLAEILRSGVGAKDDRGAHRQFVSGRAMPTTTAIGMPPYHHLCRTTTIPVFRSFQVPENYMSRAIPGPSPIPMTIANLARIGTAARAARPVDRPLTLHKAPTPKNPVKIGDKKPSTDDPYYGVGLAEQEDLSNQVKERIRRAMRLLQKAVSDDVRKNYGRSVSQKRKGDALRTAILGGAGLGIVEKANQKIRLSDREHGDMSYREQRKITNLVESLLGRRMISVLKSKKFPRIVEFKGNKTRPRGEWNGSFFVLPRVGSKRRDSVIAGTVSKYLDTFGKNGRASVLARNGSVISEKLIVQGGDVYLSIRGADWRAGRVAGDVSKVSAVGPWDVRGGAMSESDWSAVGISALADGQQDRLALLWDMNPDHVSFVAAFVEGQFV